jgi:glycosyltransferase involved in cell wall biosynthesis
MTVYNTQYSYVKRAIDSVLKQDFQDYELIILDDGSAADNRDSLMHYVEKHEDKITYIRHSNRGQSESINDGGWTYRMAARWFDLGRLQFIDDV